jgi:D-serine deaminase-like pyridoxal phosphate-dependent protein
MEEHPITPYVCISQTQVRKNCAAMAAKAAEMGVDLRPHVKTHKTIEIAKMQTEASVSMHPLRRVTRALLQTPSQSRRRIAVSTLAEVEFFAKDPAFDDILYAFPLEPHKIPRVVALQKEVTTLHIVRLRHPSAPQGRCIEDEPPPSYRLLR